MALKAGSYLLSEEALKDEMFSLLNMLYADKSINF